MLSSANNKGACTKFQGAHTHLNFFVTGKSGGCDMKWPWLDSLIFSFYYATNYSVY